jgi:hypothetical protein
MSDQGFYQRSINTGSGSAQSFDIPLSVEPNQIGAATTVVDVDTTGGQVGTVLPDATSSAGSRITVVNRTGADIVRVAPGGTDTLDGGTGSIGIAATAYASLTVVSLGANGWATA